MDEGKMAEVEAPEIMEVGILIAKQRNGPRNVTVPTIFFPRYTKFEDAAKEDKNNADIIVPRSDWYLPPDQQPETEML